MTKNPNIQLVRYKILHRVQYTGHRMFQMDLGDSEICEHTTDDISVC